MTYQKMCKITQKIAKEKGIYWEEEHAEIAFEVYKLTVKFGFGES